MPTSPEHPSQQHSGLARILAKVKTAATLSKVPTLKHSHCCLQRFGIAARHDVDVVSKARSRPTAATQSSYKINKRLKMSPDVLSKFTTQYQASFIVCCGDLGQQPV